MSSPPPWDTDSTWWNVGDDTSLAPGTVDDNVQIPAFSVDQSTWGGNIDPTLDTSLASGVSDNDSQLPAFDAHQPSLGGYLDPALPAPDTSLTEDIVQPDVWPMSGLPGLGGSLDNGMDTYQHGVDTSYALDQVSSDWNEHELINFAAFHEFMKNLPSLHDASQSVLPPGYAPEELAQTASMANIGSQAIAAQQQPLHFAELPSRPAPPPPPPPTAGLKRPAEASTFATIERSSKRPRLATQRVSLEAEWDHSLLCPKQFFPQSSGSTISDARRKNFLGAALATALGFAFTNKNRTVEMKIWEKNLFAYQRSPCSEGTKAMKKSSVSPHGGEITPIGDVSQEMVRKKKARLWLWTFEPTPYEMHSFAQGQAEMNGFTLPLPLPCHQAVNLAVPSFTQPYQTAPQAPARLAQQGVAATQPARRDSAVQIVYNRTSRKARIPNFQRRGNTSSCLPDARWNTQNWWEWQVLPMPKTERDARLAKEAQSKGDRKGKGRAK
jgi:hypothetical protein